MKINIYKDWLKTQAVSLDSSQVDIQMSLTVFYVLCSGVLVK